MKRHQTSPPNNPWLISICLLALQGAFAEHEVVLQKISVGKKVVVVQVRTTADLDLCDGLIIPGGGACASDSCG